MKKILFTFIILFSISISSQEKEVNEKIQYLINNNIISDDIVDSIFKKHRRHEKDLKLLINKSKESSYLYGQFYGHRSLGRINRDLSLFEKSISEYNKAVEITKQLKDTISELKVLNSIGSAYRRQDDIPNALNYHQEALDIALNIKNPSIDIKKSISISQNSMGNLYISLRQYELALNEFSNSIVVQKQLNNKLGLAINYQNIGNAKEELGDLDGAYENYLKSLNFNNALENSVGKIICAYSIANVLIKQKKYDKALKTVDTVLQRAIKQKDMYYLSNTYNTLGLAQVHLNKLNPAQKNLNKALQIASNYNVQNIVVRSNENLSLLYEKKKDFKKAHQYYKIAKEEDAKTYNNLNLLYVNELRSRYDKQRTKNQLKDLSKQNEIAKLQLEKNRNIFILIASLFVLLIVILYSIIRERSLRNEKKFLTLKQEALQSQMNPHFIFNALNSIKLYIINNEQKNAVYYLNKFAKLIRKILEASNVKEISLREELETMELYMSIENIRFNNEINYTFSVDENLKLDSIKIPPLVLQPFIENAIWHGLSSKKGIKKIALSVTKTEEDYILISIEDNGIGRKASAKIKAGKTTNRKSIGIGLTTERLRSFVRGLEKDFSLKYTDINGEKNNIEGTKVEIKIPLV
ncbi:hypothetical protein LPB136_10385 [Tenacibaculum todarodis]|uniref:Signal transduction histidine kinase internal region domain-containing protein n=1 Tax=Tenacibaculum todarodis TaxID=1850252 RepID=A0A1L3JKR1_9FLAO|nr:tetratricopeptide repeat protein [Tenacibaculum todarodis]APG65746.1 hypothetical protein LPB136_10385 [Tenacibaculum todarodis]